MNEDLPPLARSLLESLSAAQAGIRFLSDRVRQLESEKAAEGRRIAEEIRRELVCCDAYERGDLESPHSICYWGEAAARIAEGRKPDEEGK